MKSIKDRMEKLKLSQETKDKMFEAVLNADRVSEKKPNRRLIGILSSAAVLMFVALAAITVSVIANRSEDMIATPEEKPDSSAEQTASVTAEKESSVTGDKKDNQKDTSTSEPSKDEKGTNRDNSKPSKVSAPERKEPSEMSSDIVISSPSSDTPTEQSSVASETSVPAESSYHPIEQSSAPSETSNTETSALPIEQSSKPNETSVPIDAPAYELPNRKINVIIPDNIEVGEYAGDMYRPEGYNENIGSGLALKLESTTDQQSYYSVIVFDRGRNFNQMLQNANLRTSEPLDTSKFTRLTLNGTLTDNRYYALLTENQIFALAETGARLSYVGSGQGKVSDMNWTTAQGINTFCELNGDMYVFEGDQIRYYPDLYEVQTSY